MEKYDTNIESVNVVGQQINRLADCRFTQCGPGHLQGFAINERAAGHANLHAHMHDTHHEHMGGEHVDSGAQNHADGDTVRVSLVNVRAVEIVQQST